MRHSSFHVYFHAGNRRPVVLRARLLYVTILGRRNVEPYGQTSSKKGVRRHRERTQTTNRHRVFSAWRTYVFLDNIYFGTNAFQVLQSSLGDTLGPIEKVREHSYEIFVCYPYCASCYLTPVVVVLTLC